MVRKKSKKKNKRWKDYTAEDIRDIVKERCLKCPYSSRTQWKNFGLASVYCDYLSIMGHSRGCMPYECEHYKDDAKPVQKTKEDMKRYGYLHANKSWLNDLKGGFY